MTSIRSARATRPPRRILMPLTIALVLTGPAVAAPRKDSVELRLRLENLLGVRLHFRSRLLPSRALGQPRRLRGRGPQTDQAGGQFLLLSFRATSDRQGKPRVKESQIREDFSAAFEFEWLKEMRFDNRSGIEKNGAAWTVLMKLKAPAK